MKKNSWLMLCILLIPTVLLLLQMARNLYPYPGNYMLAWSEPWKSDHFSNGVITLSHKPVANDVFRQLYPFRTLGIDMFKKGEFPLWNPYNGLGMPLLATLNIGFLDPFNLLFFIFPFFFAWSFYISLQPFLVGAGTYLYCRKIEMSQKSALFSSVIFLLSGAVMVRYIYEIFGLAYALLPFILYLCESYLRNSKSKIILFLPIAILLLLISTQPQISLYIFIFIFTYLLFRVRKFSKLIFLAILILLGLCLASIQIFPTFELLKNSNLTQQSSAFIFKDFLFSPLDLVSFVVPNYFGNLATYNFWGAGDFIESASYVGLLPFFFIFISLTKLGHKEKKYILFFVTCAVVAIFLSLKNPLSIFFYNLPIPVISTGIPTRIFFITSFCLSILAGFGFEKLFKENIKKYRNSIIMVISLSFVILAVTFFFYYFKFSCPSTVLNCRTVALRNTLFEFWVFVFGLMSLFIFRKKGKTMQWILIGFILFVGLFNAYKYIPFSPRESFAPQNNLINNLVMLDSRSFGFGEANISTDFATFFKFYSPDYYHPLYNRRYAQLVNYINFTSTLARSDIEIPNDIVLAKDIDNQRRQRLLDLLGVKYLFYKKADVSNSCLTYQKVWENNLWIVCKNKDAVPRAYFADTIFVKKSSSDILSTMFNPTFVPNKDAVVEEKLDKTIDLSMHKILSQSFSENSLFVKIESSNNSFLVVVDNYYPGWKVSLDGKPAILYRTNYTFRGVIVPAGVHTIKMYYDPFSFKLGLIFSGVALIIYGIFVVFKLRRK